MLESLRETAETHLNGDTSAAPVSITHAVITVPVYFSQSQKAETLEAAKLAGLTEVTLITEPAAGTAMLNYFIWWGTELKLEGLKLVF